MLKLPSEELNKLIDRVLAKHGWTASRLSKEFNLAPNAITRWRAGGGIHKGHHDELLRLAAEESSSTEAIRQPLKIPFSVTIPHESLHLKIDKNGNINVSGVLLALLNSNKEDK